MTVTHKLLAASIVAFSCLTPASGQVRAPNRPAEAGTAQRPADGTIRVITYNVENWQESFLAARLKAADLKGLPPNIVDLVERERREDDEENWEVARVILHPDVRPDVWVVQEGCDQQALNQFNTQFLGGYFETVHVFKTNTERNQQVAIMIRPGFKVLEYREEFRDDPDPSDANPNSDKLFARGPSFVKLQVPGGKVIWIGTNHAKSKSGNSVPVTKWRNAEARRTNEIVARLRKEGPAEVLYLGDMNDELGVQEFEQEAGGSAIELVAGGGPTALTVLTKPLVDKGAISFHGGRRGRYRSFIDHAFATPEMAKQVTGVRVFTGDVADVASDHYPVVVEVKP